MKEIRIPASVNSIDPTFLDGSTIQSVVYEGTRAQMVSAGIDPEKLPRIDFLFAGDPVYTVAFDPNGGSVSTPSKEVRLYTSYGDLPVPAGGSGKTFLGWYTAPQGGELVTATTQVNRSEDHTLYAHWFSGVSALTPAKKGQQPYITPDHPNAGTQNYSSNYGAPVRTYLYENEQGRLNRVSWVYDNLLKFDTQKVLVEEYNDDYTLRATLSLDMELPKWGGFFAGEQYNFLFFAPINNPNEDDNQEVLRVVRYDKNWNRIDHASVRGTDGMDVYVPVTACSLRCTENHGYLYIRTGRTMYQGSDGVHHQSNWTVSIDESSMKVVESSTPGYVSHSFNQFLLTNQEGGLVSLDHGDAYPRALRLRKYTAAGAAKGQLREDGEPFDFQQFPGGIGDNYTGASVGGFVETRNGYLVTYEYDGDAVETAPDKRDARDAYYCYIDKETFTGTPVRLTTDKKGSTPIIVPMGLDGGYIMWNSWEDGGWTDTLYYTRYTADGEIGEIKQGNGKARLSDCAPVYHNGKLVWYTTYKEWWGSDDMTMTFYSMDANGNLKEEKFFGIDPEPTPDSNTFVDVHESDYFAGAVTWAVADDITSGTTTITFSPYEICSREQIVTFLWRNAGRPEPVTTVNPFTDVKENSYAYKAILWAAENHITSGNGKGKFSPGQPCTRAEAMMFLWRDAGKPAADSAKNSFTDVQPGSYYETAVDWAVANKVTTGTSKTTFSPNQPCTRAQIVSFMYRANA